MQRFHSAAIAFLTAFSAAFAPPAPASALRASAWQAADRVVAFDFDRTMRVDYFHSGGPAGETIKLDAVLNDGPWPGSRTQLIDTTDLGKYVFEVIDRTSNRSIYSRGFASIYGEWETTPEVRSANRTFHESLRFPWPTGLARVVVRKRDEQNIFRELWTTEIDPSSETLHRTAPRRVGRVSPVFENGAPGSKVDILLISEGYTAAQLPKFRADARRLIDGLFALEPFRSRRSAFNVRMLEVPGRAARVDSNVFGMPRYALTYDNRALRNLAASAPYDVLEILMNREEHLGGGIFNDQSTVAAGNSGAEYVFIHELAHNLAGLADEYVGNVTYETGAPQKAEPWEPNITALLDPSKLKWRDLVEPGTPIPTPSTYAGKVGAFEGGGYETHGLYRPEIECIMGSRKVVPFCRVCQRAITRIIDLHTK
jgi:IgA Peptidase M64/Peptidase M64 N-terminus